MYKVNVVYDQRREYDSENQVFRVAVYVENVSIEDTDTADPPVDKPEIAHMFLLKRTTTAPSPERLANSSFIRVVTSEDIRSVDPLTNIDGHSWEEMYNDSSYKVTLTDISLYDENIQAATGTQHGYYISNILIREFDNLVDADNFAEDIQKIIEVFKKRHESLLNRFSTMQDATEYPNGWEHFEL